MNLFRQIGLGVGSYSNALSFIFNNRLAYFFLFPIIFAVLIFIGGSQFLEFLANWLNGKIIELFNIGSGSGFFGRILEYGLSFLTKMLLFFLLFFITGFLVQMLMAPVLAYLSEKVDKIATGREFDAPFSQMFKDIFRGIILSLKNLLLSLIFSIIAFAVSLIPIVGLISPVILFIFSCYLYGFGFMDYANERRLLGAKDSLSFMKRYKWVAISNGLIFAIVLLLPVWGSILAVFFAIISVTAGTLSVYKLHEREKEIWEREERNYL